MSHIDETEDVFVVFSNFHYDKKTGDFYDKVIYETNSLAQAITAAWEEQKDAVLGFGHEIWLHPQGSDYMIHVCCMFQAQLGRTFNIEYRDGYTWISGIKCDEVLILSDGEDYPEDWYSNFIELGCNSLRLIRRVEP